MSTTKVLLYSAGLDSVCARHLWQPDVCVYVDLRSRYTAEEIGRLDDDVEVVPLPLGRWEHDNAIIPLRNLMLACVAAQYGGNDGEVRVAMAATAGDRSLDKTYEFAERSSDLLSWLWDGSQWWTPGKRVSVELPFKQLTKVELVRAFLDAAGDPGLLRRSFSCYTPSLGAGCGRCKPCVRRWAALTLNGVEGGSIDRVFAAALARSGGRGSEDAELRQALEVTA